MQKEVLLQGLKALNTVVMTVRGFSYLQNSGIKTIKAVGKVSGLAEKKVALSDGDIPKCG